jgi:hypothetical protein
MQADNIIYSLVLFHYSLYKIGCFFTALFTLIFTVFFTVKPLFQCAQSWTYPVRPPLGDGCILQLTTCKLLTLARDF